MAYIETTLPNANDIVAGSLFREEYPYVGSQTFTVIHNYSKVFSVEVTGVGALSESQYTLVSPNKITINDPLEVTDFIVIIYSQGNAGIANFYTQEQTDQLLDNKEDKSNKGIAEGYASLDDTGKVPLSQLPPLAPTVPDATLTTKGILKLAGDFAGTADLPTVPGLLLKADDNNVIHKSGNEVRTGSLVSDSFVKSGGTAVQYLMADGSVTTGISALIVTNVQTGTTYTLQNSDLGKQIITTNASAVTIVIPTGLPIGFNCEVLQQGVGKVTIISSGTTLRYSTFEVPSAAEQHSLLAIDNVPNITETYHIYGQLQSI